MLVLFLTLTVTCWVSWGKSLPLSFLFCLTYLDYQTAHVLLLLWAKWHLYGKYYTKLIDIIHVPKSSWCQGTCPAAVSDAVHMDPELPWRCYNWIDASAHKLVHYRHRTRSVKRSVSCYMLASYQMKTLLWLANLRKCFSPERELKTIQCISK